MSVEELQTVPISETRDTSEEKSEKAETESEFGSFTQV